MVHSHTGRTGARAGSGGWLRSNRRRDKPASGFLNKNCGFNPKEWMRIVESNEREENDYELYLLFLFLGKRLWADDQLHSFDYDTTCVNLLRSFSAQIYYGSQILEGGGLPQQRR